MKVLVACEFSGVVMEAFLAEGDDAYSCDWSPTWSKHKERHFQQSVEPLLRERWDLVVAHPPCTYLCNSGVCFLHSREGRWNYMEKACEFFVECLTANAPRVCVENPIMHCYARKIIGCGPDQCVQPWQFGHGETKATCFWLKGLPRLRPTNIVSSRSQKNRFLSPSPHRGKLRSITYKGIAEAMAKQWGSNRNKYVKGLLS